MINYKLADKLGLSQEVKNKIESRHRIRDKIEELMKETDNKRFLKALKDIWHLNEFKLQELWGFKRDINYHKWWNLPKCSCPKIDNEDTYPLGYYVLNSSCVLHGDSLK